MIELKDVIHYYVGCRIFRISASGAYSDEYIMDIDELYRINKETYPYSIKPILRLLEDATDDDIKGFIDYDKLNELYVDVSFERCVNGIVIYYGIDAGPDHGGVFSQTHKITFHTFSPKEWQYLISKGFDLFGLIETDQAIDAKTISAPMELNPYDDEPGV